MTIVACLKWIARPDHPDDERFAGVSPADLAALETALVLGEQRREQVIVVSAAPSGADRMLRQALASGAAAAWRVDLGDTEAGAADSAEVAHALAQAIEHAVQQVGGSPLSIVVCGDYSLDRGTGSVPAFVAHHLGAAQALGLLAVEPAPDDATGAVRVTRRLDGGRREVLDVPAPCVVSVEGSVATLRRAPLRRLLATGDTAVPVLHPPARPAAHHTGTAVVTPFRPRARSLPAPAGADALERLRVLTDASAAPSRGETVVLDPPAAAARIVQAMRDWGYLSNPS